MSAIKAGLEAGCLNYALIKAVPDVLSEAETLMTGAEFAYERIAKALKADGFQIWAEKGSDRWTRLTLRELLQGCNPTEPEEFDAQAFEDDWVRETTRVIESKGSIAKAQAGTLEITFTSNLADIPPNQTIVSKDGSVLKPKNRSYVAAVRESIRVLSQEEGIILASQLYFNDNAWLAREIWEWRRDVVYHKNKGVNPIVSVADASFYGGGFHLSSSAADNFGSYGRFRLAL